MFDPEENERENVAKPLLEEMMDKKKFIKLKKVGLHWWCSG